MHRVMPSNVSNSKCNKADLTIFTIRVSNKQPNSQRKHSVDVPSMCNGLALFFVVSLI